MADELKRLVESLPGPQSHLLAVPEPSKLLEDLKRADAAYPGGLAGYIRTAQTLLQRNAEGEPPVSQLRPGPATVAPRCAEPKYAANESASAAVLRRTAFVLVAGGLGERLGFSDIKVKLPVETASGTSYLAHFASWVRESAGRAAPFVIMTSDDTHERTKKFIDDHASFGLDRIVLVKQETVPCLKDNDGALAFDPSTSSLLRKPHGHGDVHGLLVQSGLLTQWADAGVSHVVFFQDTNAAMTLTLPQTLAIMAEDDVAMGFTCVPRKPGEAVGALASAVGADGVRRVQNIEYNLFDAAYRIAADADPDAAGKPSDYPGSINTLVLRLREYSAAVLATNGVVPEFINPKYVDASRTAFKSPTRVESLMQDVALILEPSAKVCGILFDDSQYNPVKNKLSDGIAKALAGGSGHCGATGEEAVLAQRRALVRAVGVTVPTSESTVVNVGGLALNLFPIVTFDNVFGGTLTRLQQRFPSPSTVHVTSRSVLVVEGDVTIESLRLDGTLIVRAAPGGSVLLKRAVVENAGWSVQTVGAAEPDELAAIRGYRLDRAGARQIEAAPGEAIVVDEAGANL